MKKRKKEDNPEMETLTFLAKEVFRISAWIIDTPEKITVKSIDDETDAEVRQIMLDRYGRYIRETKIK